MLPHTLIGTTIAAVILVGLGIGASNLSPGGSALPPTSKTVWAGVYTDDQATRGAAVYTNECEFCHMADLRGEGFAVALIEDSFRLRWQDVTLADLLTVVRLTMPQERPMSLSDEDYAAVVAYLLKMNMYPSGQQELSGDPAAVKQITFKKLEPPARP